MQVLMSSVAKVHYCLHVIYDDGFSNLFVKIYIFSNEKENATMLPLKLIWLTFAQRAVTNVE